MKKTSMKQRAKKEETNDTKRLKVVKTSAPAFHLICLGSTVTIDLRRGLGASALCSQSRCRLDQVNTLTAVYTLTLISSTYAPEAELRQYLDCVLCLRVSFRVKTYETL